MNSGTDLRETVKPLKSMAILQKRHVSDICQTKREEEE